MKKKEEIPAKIFLICFFHIPRFTAVKKDRFDIKIDYSIFEDVHSQMRKKMKRNKYKDAVKRRRITRGAITRRKGVRRDK